MRDEFDDRVEGDDVEGLCRQLRLIARLYIGQHAMGAGLIASCVRFMLTDLLSQFTEMARKGGINTCVPGSQVPR